MLDARPVLSHKGLIIDIQSTSLSPEEAELLQSPWVAGILLFSRNYTNAEQLLALTTQIREATPPDRSIQILVDQEGGSICRFRKDFTPLKSPQEFGHDFHHINPEETEEALRQAGSILAGELLTCGVDLTLAPVLDLDYGRSSVIEGRAYDADPMVVVRLASAFIEGLKMGGMGAVGKHFPGHGWTMTDSHTEVAVDDREFDAIVQADLIPFQKLAKQLYGVMPAHVIYPKLDPKPAGFSKFWLQAVLRGMLGFQGLIISDCLSMAAAGMGSETSAQVQKICEAFEAGCQWVILAQQTPERLKKILLHLEQVANDVNHVTLQQTTESLVCE